MTAPWLGRGLAGVLTAGLTAGLTLVLSGCILQTDAPLIGDAGAVRLLGPGAVGLDLFQPDAAHPGQWLASDPPHMTVRAEGGHYVVPDPTEPANAAKAVEVWFLPLDAQDVAVQVTDPTGLLYGLATWDGRTLALAMLDCKTLQDRPAAQAWLVFDGDDCHPRADLADAKALFSALRPLIGAPTLRVVVVP